MLLRIRVNIENACHSATCDKRTELKKPDADHRPSVYAIKEKQATEAAKMPFPDRASNQRINTLPGQPEPLYGQIDAVQRKSYLTVTHFCLY